MGAVKEKKSRGAQRRDTHQGEQKTGVAPREVGGGGCRKLVVGGGETPQGRGKGLSPGLGGMFSAKQRSRKGQAPMSGGKSTLVERAQRRKRRVEGFLGGDRRPENTAAAAPCRPKKEKPRRKRRPSPEEKERWDSGEEKPLKTLRPRDFPGEKMPAHISHSWARKTSLEQGARSGAASSNKYRSPRTKRRKEKGGGTTLDEE